MLELSKRSNLKELLDQNNIPAEDVILNMKELNTINTYLGGHSITLQGFKEILGSRKSISVLEIGSGGGDNLRALYTYCLHQGITGTWYGIDMNFDIVEFAKQQQPFVTFTCANYRDVVLSEKPDIIFSSLFCHHFRNEELVEQLLWMKQHARLGFFINDLHRHSLAFYSIKILTRLFSKSYLVKHDAPLSVARGFKKHEWQHIFAQTPMKTLTIKWKWAFRHLIVFKHEHDR